MKTAPGQLTLFHIGAFAVSATVVLSWTGIAGLMITPGAIVPVPAGGRP